MSWCAPRDILKLVQFWGRGLVLWRIIPFVILWTVWRERNERIFKSMSPSIIEKLASVVHLRIVKRALIRKEFGNITLNDILLNWEACMGCGPRKVRRLVYWSPPPFVVFKFNIDGAARGKMRQQVLKECFAITKEKRCLCSLKHIGVKESNKVEVMTILEAFRIFSGIFQGNLIVESDLANAVIWLM